MPKLSSLWSTSSATGVSWRSGNVLSNTWNLNKFTEWVEPIIPVVAGITGDDLEFLTGDDGEKLTED